MAGGRCDIEGGSNPAWCGRAALSPRGGTPGSSHLHLAASEELSQVGYITASGAARYSKVQNIVKLYLYYSVTTRARDGMETKTIPPQKLLFCPCV